MPSPTRPLVEQLAAFQRLGYIESWGFDDSGVRATRIWLVVPAGGVEMRMVSANLRLWLAGLTTGAQGRPRTH